MFSPSLRAACCAGALCLTAIAAHAGTLYGYDGGATDFIYRIDTETLAVTALHDPGTALLTEVEYHEGVIYATVRADNSLRFIDATSGASLGSVVLSGAGNDRVLAMEWVGDVLYGIVATPGPGGGNPSSLVTINPGTGVITYVGPTGRGAINGLAWKANEGRMYAINSGSSDTELLWINLASGAASSFGFITDDIGTRQRLSGLEFGYDGRLYTSPQFLTPNDSHLYVIHPQTLGFTDLGDTGREFITLTAAPAPCPPRMFAYDADGGVDTLHAVNLDDISITPIGADGDSGILSETELTGGLIYGSDTGDNTQLHALNPADGQVVHSVTMTFPDGGNVITAMEWVNGTLYAGFTTEGGGSGPTTLVTINTSTGAVTPIGPTGVNSPLGGIAHNPCTGDTFAVSAGGSTGRLYRLSLNTGAATLVGDLTVGGAEVNLTALEFGPDGVLYALPNGSHVLAGHLLRINPHNGNATDLGFLGDDTLNSLTADPPSCDCNGADVNGDGSVDFADLNDLLDAWADACGLMYSHTSSSGGLYAVDTDTAASTLIGTDFSGSGDKPVEMEYADGVIYVSRIWFRSIDPNTGQILTELQLASSGQAVTAMEDVEGTLYGAMAPTGGGGGPSTLVTINPANGAIASLGLTGYGPLGGLAFDTCEGTMYAVTAGGTDARLLAVDLTSGAAAPLGNITVNGEPVGLTALEFGSDGELYSMPPQNHPLWPNLIRIDRETLVGTIVGNTGLGLYAAMLTANPDTTCGGADVNDDGEVNFADLNILLEEWNTNCHPFAR